MDFLLRYLQNFKLKEYAIFWNSIPTRVKSINLILKGLINFFPKDFRIGLQVLSIRHKLLSKKSFVSSSPDENTSYR